jgi:hypothetical protein
MDDVVTKDQDITGRELSPARWFEAIGASTEECVVLLPAIHTNNRPHAVLVRIEGHSWGPRNMENRKVRGIVQCRDTTGLDVSKRALEWDAIGDEFVKDVSHG